MCSALLHASLISWASARLFLHLLSAIRRPYSWRVEEPKLRRNPRASSLELQSSKVESNSQMRARGITLSRNRGERGARDKLAATAPTHLTSTPLGRRMDVARTESSEALQVENTCTHACQFTRFLDLISLRLRRRIRGELMMSKPFIICDAA